MFCLLGLSNWQSRKKTNIASANSLSDNSGRLPQTSDSVTQSAYSSNRVRVDSSDHIDTAEDCKEFHSELDCKRDFDAEMHLEFCSQQFTDSKKPKSHKQIDCTELSFNCGVPNKSFAKSASIKSTCACTHEIGFLVV